VVSDEEDSFKEVADVEMDAKWGGGLDLEALDLDSPGLFREQEREEEDANEDDELQKVCFFGQDIHNILTSEVTYTLAHVPARKFVYFWLPFWMAGSQTLARNSSRRRKQKVQHKIARCKARQWWGQYPRQWHKQGTQRCNSSG